MTKHNQDMNGQLAMQASTFDAQPGQQGCARAKGEKGVISGWKGQISSAMRAFLVFIALGWAANAWAVSATVTVTSNINPSNLGQTVTLTATVTGGHYTPTGTVQFNAGTVVVGTVPLNSSGVATITYAFPTAGTLTVTGYYSGDSRYAASFGNLTQTVNQATSSTTVTTSPNPSTAGQPITITATVSGVSPTGTVDFYQGTTDVGTYTLTNGQAVMSGYIGLASGSYTFSARYAGDTNNTASTSAPVTQTVNAGPSTTTLATTPNPSSPGQAVNLTATVTGSPGYTPTGTVTFLDGTTTLGTATLNSSGVATLSYAFANTGTHSLTASYGGDTNNLASTSSTVSQKVLQAATTALSSSLNPSVVGQAVTLTATVTGSSPTGTVTFMDGTTTLGTGTLNASGVATLGYTFNTAGTHSLTASYAGDANNGPSTSSTVSQTVNKVVTTAALTTTPNPAGTNQAVTLTGTVTGGLNATGTLTFYDGATQLGTATVMFGSGGSLNYTFTTTGTHNLTVAYSGDANNQASTSSAVVQSIITGTTTSLTSGTNPSVAGQAVTLTATVTGNSPSGTVTFEDGGIAVGTGTLNGSGTATLSYTFNTAQLHGLTAVYGGDANNASSTSATLSQTVNQTSTTTVLSTSANPAIVGQYILLTATVSGASPTGTVTFYDGGTAVSTQTVSGGVATRYWSPTTQGTHNLTASYGGDSNNLASTSATVAETALFGTTTNLTSSANPSNAGQAVTLTATVTGTSPTGTVTFMDGTTALGTGTLTSGTATLSYTFTTPGTHSLTAVYGGDASNATSTSTAVSQTVNKAAATTTLSSGLNPAGAGQAVALTATVTGVNPTGNVSFFDGSTLLGTAPLAAGTATLNYSFGAIGTHSLTAVYSGDTNNLLSTSSAVSQSVNQGSTTTTLTPSPNPSALNQAVTLTAAVSGTSVTGAVTFLDGTTTLGTANVNKGSASLSYTFTGMGTHSLTASYSGDANYLASTSAAINQTVGKAASATLLAASPNPATTSQAVTLTATVTGSSPTGTVTFLDGTTTLGTGTLTNGTASLSYTFATAGSHPLTASYGGDASNNASTSGITAEGVATIASVYYIQPDQLGTPRSVTDTSGNLVWQYDNTDPFGNNTPNENPSNLGAFHFNLRFPGQYADVETNLYYNVNRDYDPALGAYKQSDPIGLLGGVNTYTYVRGNPVRGFDPNGLFDLPSLPQGLVNFSGGLGDALLLGQGQRLRNLFGVEGGINQCSALYTAGKVTGIAAVAIGSLGAGSAAAAGARGLSGFGGYFVPQANAAGGTVWTSIGEIGASDFATYVNSGLMQGDVTILTGVHGYVDGVMAADASLYAADVAAYGGMPGVTVLNVAEMEASSITAALNGEGTIIGAFCNSGVCLAKFW